jgi:ribosomal-protein-alanine N-acetyltransferase
MKLVPLQAEHLNAIAALEARASAYPWRFAHFADSMADGHLIWGHLNPQNQLCSYAILLLGVEDAEILNIAVDPAWQRQHLGKALMAHLIEQARSQHRARVLLDVRPSNTAARSLYRQLGFNDMGRRKGYYPGQNGREDALCMELFL